jgi:hypothetical protein
MHRPSKKVSGTALASLLTCGRLRIKLDRHGITISADSALAIIGAVTIFMLLVL